MRKLVIVAPHLGRSGPTRQMIYLVSEVGKKFDVEILCVQPESASSIKAALDQLPVRLSLATCWTFVLRWSRLLFLSIFGRIDIFHSYGFLPDLLCAVLLSRKKWVCVARNFPLEDYPPKFGPVLGKFMAHVHLGLHRRCRNLVVCSQSLAVKYNQIGISNVPIRNAVGFKHESERFLEKESRRRFIFLGNLIPRKRVDLTCRLFEAFKNNQSEIDIVGGGNELARLQAIYGENPSIRFHGPQADISPFLKRAQILMSLSASEGLPNAVLEGLAAGCFCVLSDIAPHREIKECIGVGVIIVSLKDNPTKAELETTAQQIEHELSCIPSEQALLNLERTRQVFGTKRLAREFELYYSNIES